MRIMNTNMRNLRSTNCEVWPSILSFIILTAHLFFFSRSSTSPLSFVSSTSSPRLFNMPSFTTIVTAIAGCSAVVHGAAVPSKSGLTTVTLETRNEAGLSKREPVIASILLAAGTAAVSAVVTEAVSATAKLIGDIANFDDAREAFTQQTTDEMMARNPDPARFQAAACYNKAFSVADPANIDGQNSVKFSLGLLNTDYECMYIAAPNQFFTEGDGGFINASLEYMYASKRSQLTLQSQLSFTHTDRCTFDQATADLTCV